MSAKSGPFGEEFNGREWGRKKRVIGKVIMIKMLYTHV
jgi:hypothetical protein